MKICGSCGHINYSVTTVKKKRVCHKCLKTLDGAPQSAPMLGHFDEDGNRHIGLILQSDERG